MSVVTLVGTALGRFVSAARPVDLVPGRMVELPGRGRTCVIDLPGPPGAPTVILIHALATTAALSWYPSMPELAKHYRVVAFDQRWHGRGIRSEKFLLDDCADDVVAVADALGIDRFILVGYSMGGAITQLTWRRHRSRVSGLVLAATARNFRGKPTERLWFTFTSAAMTRFGARAYLRMTELASTLADEPAGLRADQGRVAPWALAEFRSTSKWSFLAALNEMGRFESSAWIRRVDVPTSVIVATRDRLIPTRRQRRLAASIPQAVCFDVDANHAALVLSADVFVPVVLAACASVQQRIEAAARRVSASALADEPDIC